MKTLLLSSVAAPLLVTITAQAGGLAPTVEPAPVVIASILIIVLIALAASSGSNGSGGTPADVLNPEARNLFCIEVGHSGYDPYPFRNIVNIHFKP